MSTTIDAPTLSLEKVHRLLRFQRQGDQSIVSLLRLEPLTEQEQARLEEIRRNFAIYYEESKILEGQVQFLFLSPLMWLAGFHSPRIQISLEVGIAEIETSDADTLIKGRMDILATKRLRGENETHLLWVLLIESKNSSVDATEGLPQLLTYAYRGLGQQRSVWGLTTNGMDYQFVYIQQGDPPTYQLFPKLSLLYSEQSNQLLQVLKGICDS
ncbi:restriction endonuclease subunit R [Kovacikia minuta CCNUW1]|uniref:restriction endonuclease subunit R n=1 Tax=Kovacikia minuta TaxID=2931930 RepID=UPI001CCDCEE6|nr:restriction endonuclease subunit R [Kovacikia minuta]UBF23827.1 restriction endonuclease subunit R [Kovacikia minuta CCNUW1]